MASTYVKSITGLFAAGALLMGATGADAADRVKIEWWYAISGKLGDTVQQLISDFNKSQDKYEVVGTFKGNYEETMAAMVAAYRVNQQPAILQSAERGFMTMLNSGAVIPVDQLMAKQGYKTDWNDFIKPVAGFYIVNGKPAALPFNSSTPILWYNADAFKAAGFDAPSDTWQGLEKQLYALKEKKITDCSMALPGDFQWSLIENYSAINNYPFATKANGYAGLDTEFVYNKTGVVGQVARLKKWVDDGVLKIAGQGVAPISLFTSGTCATIINSTASHSGVEADAKFKWSAAVMPHEEGADVRNGTIGGASLWAVKGKSEEVQAGVAAFFNFVAQPDTQEWWSKATGYVPVTNTAYRKMKAEGYFKDHPTREIAIEQLSRGEPTDNSRGFRFGNHNQSTAILIEEIQAVWTGKKTPQEALDNSVKRGNEILRQYEKLHAGK
ncbi:sn-glycerol 3-phosphate transport system substrate-binding protein [Neorhizobium sp. 2083]|uniref:extracellular solute-binding protein n=1 Tax=Neorhizobium sp. 2083 TaxID=2817762 RepID=UPI002856634C|nr:sn-glycerol 3-phosphate transport system substrate-binding protein [Neorhizobium sp. 2083]